MKRQMLLKVGLACLCIVCMVSLFAMAETVEPVKENYEEKIQQLQREVSDLKTSLSYQQKEMQEDRERQNNRFDNQDNFYNKTMQNVNLSLQGANRATSLVSVFAILFTVLTFILGFWGLREMGSIRKVRLDAEKNLKLAKHFNLATSYTQGFIYTEAVKEFLKVIELDDNNAFAHGQLGFLFTVLPKPDLQQSKHHSKRAIELDPNNYVAYLNLGVAMSHTGEKKEDVLAIYLRGETIAIEQLADDITIGKFKLFAGHNFKDLKKYPEAKAKYDEARTYFEKQKNNQNKDIAFAADRWIKELEDNYKALPEEKI